MILLCLDAEVWDVVVVFKFATGNIKEGIENRFKQLRALVTKQSWELSEETTNKVDTFIVYCELCV